MFETMTTVPTRGNYAGDDTFAESNDARSHEVGQPVDLWAR